MSQYRMDRRTVLKAAAAFAATSLASCASLAPSGGSRSLPARGSFVIRRATVLTGAAAIGDFIPGDVYVRDGTIVAIGPHLDEAGVSVIDARGMICMPGFVDTHWPLWTSVCRPFVSIDDPKRGYFPVTNALGRHYTPEDC